MSTEGWKSISLEAFMAKVHIDEAGCWIWQGTGQSRGYGMVNWKEGGKWTGTTAHRWIVRRLGRTVDGMDVDHLCKVRRCVNPEHLEVVTHRVNMERGSNATRTHCKHGHSLANAYIAQGKSGVQRHCRNCKQKSSLARYYKRKGRTDEAKKKMEGAEAR